MRFLLANTMYFFQCQLVNPGAAQQRHVPFKFGPVDLKRSFHAPLATCSQRIEIAATDGAGIRTQRQCLEDVCAALYTAVHDQLDELTDPARFVGRAPEQVSEFLTDDVDPALAEADAGGLRGSDTEPTV